MVSVSSTHLVLFIASVVIAASLAGALTTEASRLSGTLEAVGFDRSDEIDTDIEIISDVDRPMYDSESGNLTVHVRNIGASTPPHAADQIDVFLDGEFQVASVTTVTILDGSTWAPNTVARIRIEAPDLAWGDHRVQVVVDGDSDVAEFRNCAGIDRESVVFEQNANGNLAVINRSGVITDLGVNTVGFGPHMADFDCDGVLEAPYLAESDQTINIIDVNGQQQQLTTNGIDLINRRLAAADLDGDGKPAVIYPNGSDNAYLYRVELGEATERIGSGFPARSVGGVADFTGDGDLDIVYIGTNEKVHYLDNGSATDTGANAKVALGIGSPMDFDGDGEIRVPIRGQTDNLIRLVDSDGNEEVILSLYTGATGTLASFDWNDDGTPDILTSNGDDQNNIYYLQLNGTNTPIQDENGDAVPSTDLGVA